MNIKQSIYKVSTIIILLSTLSFSACKKAKENTETAVIEKVEQPIFFEISLAQWSLNKKIRGGEMDPFDFAKEAKSLGFEAIEYVSGLYKKQVKNI